MRSLLVFLTVICFSTSAFAQSKASTTRTDRGWSHAMCLAETTNGVCDTSGGEDIYAWVANYESFTVFITMTGGTAVACDVYAAGIEIDMVTDLGAAGFTQNKINSVSLSDTQDAITFTGGNFENVWIKCASIDTTVTVTLQGSVGLHRTKR